MEYKVLEESVFNYLNNLVLTENDYFFSVRKKATKGSERDYFIGTKESNYSLFSLWKIDSFIGSPTDVIDYVFTLHDGCFYSSLQFVCSRNPENEQGEACFALGQLLLERLGKIGIITTNSNANSQFIFHFKLKESQAETIELFLNNLKSLIDKTKVVIDNAINEVKVQFSDFKANSISKDDFENSIQKLNKRREKYQSVEINTSISNKENQQEKPKEINLNQILYGPPGTGKTYLLQNNYFPLFRNEATSQTKEDFEYEVISKLKWWQVIAMILLEKNRLTVPEMKEHRFTKYKISVSNTKSLNQTFWGQLSSHTIQESKTVEYSTRSKTLVFNKEEENSIWFIEDSKKTQLIDLIELLNEIKSFQTKPNNKNNFSFITFHQSYAYEDFVIGIKPTLNDDDKDDNNSEIAYQLEKGVFYKSCDEAAKLAGFLSLKDAIENYSKEERSERFKAAKPFGLFIDEINRGNVSAIFGELITLIEDDKRLGKVNELILNIPNAEKFAVPSNLYLIGTMNTADRSVEALDTALRRRFSFVEMLPDPTKLIDENNQPLLIKDINLQDLLFTINKRIEFLVDRDHTIGHAFFIGLDSLTALKSTFKNKIIPLLQEYFYGNYYNIELVLGSSFFHKKEKSKVKFAIDSSEVESDGYIYDFIDLDKMDDDKFMQLLKEIKLESFSLQE